MGSIDRNHRCAGTLVLCLAFIQCATQPFYSASAAGRWRPGINGTGNPAVPKVDEERQAELARRTEVPLVFEANQGQANSEFKFISRSSGQTMFISPRRVVIMMHTSERLPEHLAGAPVASIEMKLSGGTAVPLIEGIEPQKGKANYFIGQDPAAWRTGIQTFGSVRARSVYPGIDLVFHGSRDLARGLEYDFVLAPGARPDKIALVFGGASSLRLDGEDLVLSTQAGELRQPKPVAYQEVDGIRKLVASRYEIKSKGRGRIVRFRLGPYDRGLPLVIDPSLVFSGRVAGTASTSSGIAIDASGNSYITGTADPAVFPVTVGGPNQSGSHSLAFLAKFDPEGGLIYSTIFGGSPGAGGSGVAVDAQGNAYVVGGTSADDFPVTKGAFQTVKAGFIAGFVTKLNANGSGIVYSTFLSGSNEDTARYVAVDISGNAYVTGMAGSRDFPTTPGAFQTVDNRPSPSILNGSFFVTKLNSTGTALLYSTFLDGEDSGTAGFNILAGIAIDPLGNAYVTGTAGSADFPTTAGSFQPHRYGLTATIGGAAFVTKINPSGSALVYSTFVGDNTNGRGIAADARGNAYVTGLAATDDFPAVNAIQSRMAGGIVMKTTNGGQTATNISRGLADMGIYSALPVVAPSNPSVVYALSGPKLARSEDGGGSWSLTGGGGLPTTDLRPISLAVDPSDSSKLLLGMRGQTSGAIFSSNDSGDHWRQLSTVPDGGLIAIDPKTSSTIYATSSLISSFNTSGTTLIKSSDGGATWNPAGQGLVRGVHVLAIDPVNTSNLYAGSPAGLFRSNDAGGNWSQTAANHDVRSIAVDPRRPNTIYALDIDSSGEFFFMDNGQGRGHSKKRAAQNTPLNGVIKSDDGGSTWVSINDGLFMGMSLGALAVDPGDGAVYLGAFEGLFKSTNQGGLWNALPNLVSRATFSIAVDPRDQGTLYLGGQTMSDAFITKLAPDGASAVYSTLLGGFAQDDARCIALDASGNVFVSGATNSGNFPVTPNAVQREWSGGDDVYVAEINAAGTAIQFATYLGGSDDDDPMSIAVDPGGNPVVTGVTQSTDFPIKVPAGTPFFSSAGGMFVFKISTQGSSSQEPQVTNASVSGKRLTVQGQSFDQGAVIVIGGADLPTTNDSQDPSSMLVSKKGGKRITPGQQVTIQVRNSDGTMSNPYSYTRPAN
jgi:hypothetical protein